jgi:hypothetical protein
MIHAISLADIAKYHSTLWCVGQLAINQLCDFPSTKLCAYFILLTISFQGRCTKGLSYVARLKLVAKNVGNYNFVCMF